MELKLNASDDFLMHDSLVISIDHSQIHMSVWENTEIPTIFDQWLRLKPLLKFQRFEMQQRFWSPIANSTRISANVAMKLLLKQCKLPWQIVFLTIIHAILSVLDIAIMHTTDVYYLDVTLRDNSYLYATDFTL